MTSGQRARGTRDGAGARVVLAPPTGTDPPAESATHGNLGESREDSVDHATPPSLRALLDLCATYMAPVDLELVRAAHGVAAHAHAGVLRVSGEPFIEHPLAVATILAELAMDAQGIAAALLHDTVEDTSYTLGEAEQRFGAAIAAIVDGVTKFDVVELSPPADGTPLPDREQRVHLQKETVRKLLLAMLRDPRVVLLKLADRLHNLRTLGSMSLAQRQAKARETLEIYAPLADRIGLQVFKSELEDLAFSYLQPDEFARVDRRLRDLAASRHDWAERIGAQVTAGLAAAGITAAVNWRLKRPYRAHLETSATGMSESQIHDIIAFRVLVDNPQACYRALGAIHARWRPMDLRIRDYIATPKINGYRSLHTSVYADGDRIAQFHIRTHDMHRWVQHGVAAHWLDLAARHESVDAAARPAVRDLPVWVAQLDHWHRDLSLTADEFVDALKSDIFDDQVFVFTPAGDLIDLPAGSTALDFAYRIHTGLGEHFAAALVQTRGPDGLPLARRVTEAYQLKTGDVVTIVSDPAIQPREAWLAHLRTRNAREKVARQLRVRAQGAAALDGQAGAAPAAGQPGPLLHPSGRRAAVRLARCCYPCPGDEAAGLAGPGRAVTIHRTCCRTLAAALARRRQQGRSDQTLVVDWRARRPDTYRMAVAVYGEDHAGLMHQLATRAGHSGINLTGSSARAIRDRNKAIVTLICEFGPGDDPESFFRRLRTTPGVSVVGRDTSIGCHPSITPE